MFPHLFEQAEGPFPMEQEIFVEDKKGRHFQLFLQVGHDAIEFFAAFIEIFEFALPTKQGGS